MIGILHALVEDAAREAGCTVAQILGQSTHKPLVHARHRAMRRAFEEGFSSSRIGAAFNRDHTTVLYAIGALSGKRPTCPRYSTFPQASSKDETGTPMVRCA